MIIAGDFWDIWHTSFDRFLSSEWSRLFPLLRKKQAIYLWGNHDPAEFMDSRVKRFCLQLARECVIHAEGHSWTVTHGDVFTTTNERMFRVTHEHELAKTILRIWERMESFVARLFGRNGLVVFDRKYDVQVRNAVRRSGRRYITGHTHVFRTLPETGFINTGFVRHGLGQTIEIRDGVFHFSSEWYY